MKEIQPANELIKAICGDQKKGTEEYRCSNHTFTIPCGEGMLYYSVLTGELILVDDPETDRDYLIRNWFLVPADCNERDFADQINRTLALMHTENKKLSEFTVFTTTDCNARCYYCYETGKKRESMSEETAHAAAQYIYRSCGGCDIKINWFGGEPLFNNKVIDLITGELADMGIKYRSGMTSNAYLFDGEMVKRAAENWNLRSITIPIDGTREVYNRTKAYIYEDDDPYSRVMHNIDMLLDADIKVLLRLNVGSQNIGNMELLTDELIERFHDTQGIKINMAMLREFGGYKSRFKSEDAEILGYDQLQRKLIESGLGNINYPVRTINYNQCMADNDSAVTILPDGRLGRCTHRFDTDTVGSIYEDQIDLDMMRVWKERISCDECDSCLFYPSCIKIIKCPWHFGTCHEYDRKRQWLKMRQMVYNAYNRYKAVAEQENGTK